MPPRNIVLFGESGAGKSSIINMLIDKAVENEDMNHGDVQFADISSHAKGCTFQSHGYNVTIGGIPFSIYDTAGLDEGEEGRIPNSTAIVQLYTLLKSLDNGVSLLIFCMKAPRIKESAKSNWRLFNEIICRRKVPIAIIITGLEQEKDMDQWWFQPENREAFRKYEMYPVGQACITATKGKQRKNGAYMLQEEYDESCGKVQDLIKNSYLEMPWRMEPVQWFKEVIYETTFTTRWCRDPVEHKRLVSETKGAMDEMVSRCGMSEKEAEVLAKQLETIR